MFKRIFFFILTNILVIITISIICSVFGIGNYIDQNGINFGSLLIFSAVVGFTGAFISLAISRWMAKMMMGVQVLDPQAALNAEDRQIVEMVHRLSRNAGLTTMPQVGVYESPEVNAFATGPSKSRSLVAVSRGLLEKMDRDAVEGVIAHEVAHIANGDMVTMTLLQGVVNTFVVFLSRVAAYIVSRFVREDLAPIVHFIAVLVFQILFSILGSLVVMAYSRHREYHADRGGANLAGRDKMVHALQSLKKLINQSEIEGKQQSSLATLKISSRKRNPLFSTHPDLDDRIERLKQSA